MELSKARSTMIQKKTSKVDKSAVSERQETLKATQKLPETTELQAEEVLE